MGSCRNILYGTWAGSSGSGRSTRLLLAVRRPCGWLLRPPRRSRLRPSHAEALPAVDASVDSVLRISTPCTIPECPGFWPRSAWCCGLFACCAPRSMAWRLMRGSAWVQRRLPPFEAPRCSRAATSICWIDQLVAVAGLEADPAGHLLHEGVVATGEHLRRCRGRGSDCEKLADRLRQPDEPASSSAGVATTSSRGEARIGLVGLIQAQRACSMSAWPK